MDDILYIVLGVAWLAYSLYSNKQKLDKKRAQQVEQMSEPNQENQTSEPLEEAPRRTLLEEMFGEIESEYTEAEEEIFIPEVDERATERRMRDYSRNEAESLEVIKDEVPLDYFTRRYASGYAAIEDKNEVKIVLEEEKEDEEVSEKFNLMKAVIYSEILRAPYIHGGI